MLAQMFLLCKAPATSAVVKCIYRLHATSHRFLVQLRGPLPLELDLQVYTMAAKQFGNFLITSSLLTVAVTATVCPVRFEIETKQASSEYYWDARFTSSNVITVTTQSAIQCIQRCLKECLCYHANYKAIKARAWECQLVSYSECGVKSGVRIEDDTGWSAVKLMKVSEIYSVFLSSYSLHSFL